MQQPSGRMMQTDFQKAMMWSLVVALTLLSGSSADVTCKDRNGGSVDWFILYKENNGFEYFYIDPTKAEWIRSNISHQNGCLGKTLQPYIDKSANTGVIAYSDQPPKRNAGQQDSARQKRSAGQKHKADQTDPTDQNHHPSKKYGHSKGLIMMDDNTIVWLLHSTPNFPFERNSTSFYPESGKANAQTFICVTFKKEEASKIARHLRHINAFRFDVRELKNGYNGYKNLFNGKREDPNEIKTLQDLHQGLKSRGGQVFRSFFKKVLEDNAGPSSSKKPKTNNAPNQAEVDLYAIIAENLADKHVKAQTWGQQAGRDDPYCPKNGKQVHDVILVKIRDKKNSIKKSWRNTQDHSKWCVSDKGWTCFGDSNRARSQYKRPGGALCIQDQRVTDLFQGFIACDEGCDDDTSPSSSP